MRSECIEELIRGHREIEFKYKGEWYSITYYCDNRDKWISFCKFYQEPIDVSMPHQVLELKIGNRTLDEIFSQLPDDAFVIG